MILVLIEEFVRRLDEMRIQYPGDAEDVLEAGAKKMTKAIRKASPVGDTNHPHKLKKSWRCKIKGGRYPHGNPFYGTSFPFGEPWRAEPKGYAWQSETGMAQRFEPS